MVPKSYSPHKVIMNFAPGSQITLVDKPTLFHTRVIHMLAVLATGASNVVGITSMLVS